MVVAGRRVRLAALAGAATLLAGCGLTPGTAAVVGPETISHDQVDDLTRALCSANMASAQSGAAPVMASRGARELAVSILVETALSQQFGEAEGIEVNRGEVSRAVAQNEAGLATLPEEHQEVFRETLREYAEGQMILIEAGRESLGESAPEEQAIQEGVKLRNEFAQDVEVEIDPRYGSFQDGEFTRGGTSLSVAASDRAKAGDQDQPDQSFVGTLPASQQCS